MSFGLGPQFISKQAVAPAKNEVRVNPAAKRYRPGVVPEFARGESDDTSSGVFAAVRVVSKEQVPDRRLSRISQSQNQSGDQDERMQRHKRIIQEAEIVGVDVEEEEETDLLDRNPSSFGGIEETEEDAVMMRNERLRRAMRQQEDDDNAGFLPLIDEEDFEGDGDEDSSEGDSDDDSEDGNDWGTFAPRAAIQPRFVNKEKRVTVIDKEKAAKEEEAKKLQKVRQLDARKIRTLEQLKGTEIIEGTDGEIVMEEEVDTDEEGPAEKQIEFDEWRLRELQRVRRDREEREKMKQEQLEVESRRGMTDQEVLAEKKKLGIGMKEQKKINFLQKYYHKGAYYADEIEKVEGVHDHDWAAPVGEDKYVDRSMLPKVMQVKNFGRSGRTKYTHLKDQDTAQVEDTYNVQKQQIMPERLKTQLGGFGSGPTFQRPAKARKLSNNTSATSSSDYHTNSFHNINNNYNQNPNYNNNNNNFNQNPNYNNTNPNYYNQSQY
jgi:microfibrillar-associated protein 1